MPDAAPVTRVRWSPLPQQFAAVDEVFAELRTLVASGDFTLGRVVTEFEQMFAQLIGIKHAIGVGSGTDSLKLPLKALGLQSGDEVITAANTFYATAGAINEVGARPVFVDCCEDLQIDVSRIEKAITPRTKAIMPVHLTGAVCDMRGVMQIARRHNLPVVEDACQSLLATRDGKFAGAFGIASGFSLHPLKILHVWGDGGVVVTNDDGMARQLRLLRNHGLRNRDEMEIYGYNSRLDSTQAVVGKWMVRRSGQMVAGKRRNAARYDAAFRDLRGVRIPPYAPGTVSSWLFYVLLVDGRDALLKHCLDRGIEAKVHYPIPLYQQDALRPLGYKKGDFPVTERLAEQMISLPVDEELSAAEIDYVIAAIRGFYA